MAGGYVLILVAAISLYAVTGNLFDRDKVVSWTDDAEVYSKITPAAIDLLNNPETDTTLAETVETSSVDAEKFEAAITEAFPPSYYVSVLDGTVDKIYDRLENGPSDETAFRVAAGDRTEILGETLGELLKSDLRSLRGCSDEQLEVFGETFDPFALECLPKQGFSLDDEVDAYIAQLSDDDSFLGGSILTDEDVFEDGVIENAYDWLQAMRVILPVLLLGAVVIFIVSSTHPFAALRNLGYVSVVVSLVMTTVWLAVSQFGAVEVSITDESDPSLSFATEILVPIMQNAVNDIASSGVRLSLWSVLIGVLLIAIHFVIEKTGWIERVKKGELYKKLAGGSKSAMTIADISTEANKSDESKAEMLEQVKEVGKVKKLANDDELTVEQIAKKAAPAKKKKRAPAKKKAAPAKKKAGAAKKKAK